MSGEVFSIFGGTLKTNEPNATCVKCLEEWLEMARSGEIVGVVIAGMSHDKFSQYSIGGLVGGYGIIGAIQIAQQELIKFNMSDE